MKLENPNIKESENRNTYDMKTISFLFTDIVSLKGMGTYTYQKYKAV